MTSFIIEDFLKENGPVLSSKLIKLLESKGVSNDNAGKRLSRLKFPVTKINGFFQDNQSLFYLQEQYKSEEYYDALVSALRESSKHYYSVMKAIQFHHGFLNKEQLPSFTCNPVKNLTSHKNISNIIENLIELNLIRLEDEDYKLTYYAAQETNNNYRYHKGVELAKETVINQFYNWARNIGLVSYDTGKFYSEFSKFDWAFVAPSYITGILKHLPNKSISPAFVVADVLIGNAVGIDEIYFFIKKVEITKLVNTTNFLPFLIVSHVSGEALKLLKQKGIVVAFVDKMFGSEYEELLKSLISTITNAGAVLKNNPQAYIDLIHKLNKLVDGKTNNLRGDLFELAVGYYHSNNCQNIDIGKKILHDGRQREIDVYAIYQTEIRIAECKGVKYKIDVDYVEKWLSDRLPLFYSWTRTLPENGNKKVVFEFWATAGFTDDALKLLEAKKRKTKKYKIEIYNDEEMLELAQSSNAQKFVDILREYFLKDV